jgi:hypothetical protein
VATTTGALAQNALNICVPLQNNIANGVYEDPYKCISDLCAAINCLAEAYYATLVATAAATSTAVGVTPAIGNQYSAVQSTTAPIFTAIR